LFGHAIGTLVLGDDEKQVFQYVADPSKCLDVDSSNQQIMISSCTGESSQLFIQSSDNSAIQSANDDTLCLEIDGAEDSGVFLHMSNCNMNLDTQGWMYDSAANRIFHCKNSDCNENAFCVDLPGGDASPRNNLWMWQCNDDPAQQWALAPAPPAPSPSPEPSMGSTSLTDALNAQIAWGGDYTGGKGILVRSPIDGLGSGSTLLVAPATFWVNDLYAPSQLYPTSGASADPWCPNEGDSGFGPVGACYMDPLTQETGPWNYAQMAVVVASQMDQFFPEFDHIQDDDWGYGVFYATDSNAVDKRCRHLDEYQGFDCPSYWQSDDGNVDYDEGKKGAGAYPAGNPYADSNNGGGAGCHFEPGMPGIDQTNAYDIDGDNLVMDQHCQCNYKFADDWSKWVELWIVNGDVLNGGKGPSWAVDLGMCWTNNPRSMIAIQNQLWWLREEWNNGLIPAADYSKGEANSERPYWGWNEIPVDIKITDSKYWDAVFIKLPAAMQNGGDDDSLYSLTDGAQQQLIADIDIWVDSGFVELGPSGRQTVVVREPRDSSGNYFRTFFCQNWSYGKYSLVYQDDKCFLQASSSHVVV